MEKAEEQVIAANKAQKTFLSAACQENSCNGATKVSTAEDLNNCITNIAKRNAVYGWVDRSKITQFER